MRNQFEFSWARNDGRHLFEVKKGGRRLGMTIKGRGRLRHYIGFINGEACAMARGKGELWSQLLAMASKYPPEPAALL